MYINLLANLIEYVFITFLYIFLSQYRKTLAKSRRLCNGWRLMTVFNHYKFGYLVLNAAFTLLPTISYSRILGRYAALILGPAGVWLTLLIFVSSQPFLLFPHIQSQLSLVVFIFIVVVFVAIMRACRNRFIPHYHANVVLYPVNMC